MLYDADIQPPQAAPRDDDDDVRPSIVPQVGPLPPGLVLTQRCAGILRQYLISHELSGYRILHSTDLDLEDTERYLKALGESAAWEPIASVLDHGAALDALTHGSTGAKIWRSGILHLQKHEIVLARWYWVDEHSAFRQLWLCAAPTAQKYLRLRDEVRAGRRARGNTVWQVIRDGWGEPERLPRESLVAEELILTVDLRSRIERDVVHFFSPQVVALYASLKVSHRRGVLLHGPPGNGKTSLIRLIGATLPDVPMFVLRPSSRFNADALQLVITRWKSQAPAALIIEDLDWLLKNVNISAFLNALDGIDTAPAAGMLLIATTNHPAQLDAAINNRPGRFDVVIEIPCPDKARNACARFLPGPSSRAARLGCDRPSTRGAGATVCPSHTCRRFSAPRACRRFMPVEPSEAWMISLAPSKPLATPTIRLPADSPPNRKPRSAWFPRRTQHSPRSVR